jgi:predicted DsbA family dithiol-disulfide isomerase
MRAYLFENRDKLADAIWLKSNEHIGVNVDTLGDCLDQADQAVIREDQTEASRLGVRSTPTFFIGRRTSTDSIELVTRINGALPFADFREALNRALSM